MAKTREELKEALQGLGARGRGKQYPKSLVASLVSYATARGREGATLKGVAEEVGMSWKTLSRWIGERRPAGKARRFQQVQVVAEPPKAEVPTLIVYGARGVRVEGLDFDGVVELLWRVSH
jgi:hypothetical protein